MHQDELARQFAQSQQHRYGETYQHDTQQAEDDDTAAEAELARQFCPLRNSSDIPASNPLARSRSHWTIWISRQ
ncbi:DNA translocase FtsK [Salmonella enterica subsp. enterica]|uniref:DNA translocase FtsK n=1 Tax=Salmonella enterica I TaxID=59201 RepID=A0A3S4F4U9_SALET|nr:DNA translocase FtsK [Salmonella enterica subsp. enterica]